jgi:CspA family cold shock protein
MLVLSVSATDGETPTQFAASGIPQAVQWVRSSHQMMRRLPRRRELFFKDSSSMPQGTIKKKTDKGFGFITTENGTDLFFHSSNVDGSYESLREGQKVSYTEGRGPKGPRAENVRAI